MAPARKTIKRGLPDSRPAILGMSQGDRHGIARLIEALWRRVLGVGRKTDTDGSDLFAADFFITFHGMTDDISMFML
jgi:hypothetical protein